MFEQKVTAITDNYLNVIERAALGEQTISLDEMTGIQALERKYPDKVMDAFKENLPIIFDEYLPKWNYRAISQNG